MSLLVSDNESKHNPIQPPDNPVEVILFYMDQKGLTRKDMEWSNTWEQSPRFGYPESPALTFSADDSSMEPGG